MDNYQIPNTDNIGFEEEEPVYHRNKLVKKLEFEFDDIVYPRRHIDEAFEKKRDTLTFANGMELKKSTDYTNLAKIDTSDVTPLYVLPDESRLARKDILMKPTDRTSVINAAKLEWRGMKLPDGEGMSIYPRVNYRSRRVTKWINSNGFTDVGVVCCDSGALLAPYMLLSSILRDCPKIENLTIICSDSWYSAGCWGQYFFVSSDQKIYLPTRSRVFAVQEHGYRGIGVIQNADMYGYKVDLDHEIWPVILGPADLLPVYPVDGQQEAGTAKFRTAKKGRIETLNKKIVQKGFNDWLDEYVEPFLVNCNLLIEKLKFQGRVCTTITGEVCGEWYEPQWAGLDLTLREPQAVVYSDVMSESPFKVIRMENYLKKRFDHVFVEHVHEVQANYMYKGIKQVRSLLKRMPRI